MNETANRFERAVEHRSEAPDSTRVLVDIAQRVRRKRRRRLAGAGVFAILLGLGGVALQLATDDGTAPDLITRDSIAPSTTMTTAPAPISTVSTPVTLPMIGDTGRVELPLPPLEVRGAAAVVWTGDDLVIWGGYSDLGDSGLSGPDRAFDDGAAFDPLTSTWRPLADSPLTTFENPLGLATSEGVLIASGRSIALWAPSSDTWTALPDAPGEIFDLVGDGPLVLSASANAALDLMSNTWSPLPEPPVALKRPSSVWTGTSMIVIGGPDTPFTNASALRYDPATGEWSTLPQIPGLSAEAISAAWDGERVIAVNYDMSAVTYDPQSNEWSQLPLVPARFAEWSPTTLSTGGTTLTHMAETIALLRNDEWLPLPTDLLAGDLHSFIAPVPGSAATFFVWSFDSAGGINHLAAIDLDAAFDATQTIQVGLAAVEVGTASPISISYDPRPNGVVEARFIEQDGFCTMTSSYGFGGQATDWNPIVVTHDGVDTPWRVSPDGATMNTAPTSSDIVEITCEQPSTALEMAGRTTFAFHEQRDD